MKKIMWIDPETEEVLVDTESILSAADGSTESDNTAVDTNDDGFGGQDPFLGDE